MKSFKIPGSDALFYQHDHSQSVSNDTYDLYVQVREYICFNLENNEALNEASLLDIGTGTGILLLMLAMEFKNMHFTGVEIIKEIADIATTNFENLSKHMDEKIDIEIINTDYCKLSEVFDKNRKFDLIVSNPPYFPKGTGIMSSVYEKAVSRFELAGNLSELLKCIENFLAPEGKAFLIYPVFRAEELRKLCDDLDLMVTTHDYGFVQVETKKKLIFEIYHA